MKAPSSNGRINLTNRFKGCSLEDLDRFGIIGKDNFPDIFDRENQRKVSSCIGPKTPLIAGPPNRVTFLIWLGGIMPFLRQEGMTRFEVKLSTQHSRDS